MAIDCTMSSPHLENAIDYPPDDPQPSDRVISLSKPQSSEKFKYTELYQRCTDLDFDKLVSQLPAHPGGHRLATLSTVSTWSIESCSICRLMFDAISRVPFDLPRTHYDNVKPRLWSYSTSRMLPSERMIDRIIRRRNKRDKHQYDDLVDSEEEDSAVPFHGTKYLNFKPEEETKYPKIRIVPPNDVDFELLKARISICQKKVEHPTSFKLIDCKTNQIIAAEDNSYIALSYVWGTIIPDRSHKLGYLPENLPLTVRDSIVATTKLGFRYLWVDAYCINQECQEEGMEKMPKMDVIYQNAALTIIACAGYDSDYGLPGVSVRKRQPQAYSVDEDGTVTTLDNPQVEIQRSNWSSRAWTYQEGLLSQRRLVFTDRQDVYDEGYKSYHISAPGHDRAGYFPFGVGTKSWDVVERIQEYSLLAKNLTDPADILKGVLGILNAFETGSLRLSHYGGISLLPPYWVNKKRYGGWTPSQSFFSGLCWNLRHPSTRNPNFPSWSWTGWMVTAMIWGHNEDTQKDMRIDDDIEVTVVTKPGRHLELRQDRAVATNNVKISAWISTMQTIDDELFEDYQNTERTTLAEIPLENGNYVQWSFQPTTSAKISPKARFLGYTWVTCQLVRQQ